MGAVHYVAFEGALFIGGSLRPKYPGLELSLRFIQTLCILKCRYYSKKESFL